MYARPQFDDGETTTLGVSGKLWRDALIMYDRRSRSLWSQIDGEAKAGPLEGQSLTKIPSQMTTWSAWKASHPDTLVLVKPALEQSPFANYHDKASWVGLPWTRGGKDDRLPGKALVLGIELGADTGDTALAVDLAGLADPGLVEGSINDLPLLVVAPGDPRAALVYLRRAAGEMLEFEWHDDDDGTGRVLADRQTASRWDWQTGECVAGQRVGQRLEPLPASPIYWATWVLFHPRSVLW